jgi:DUF2934 family protein
MSAVDMALEDRIRQRAYQLYEARINGSALDDWVKAERKVLAAKNSKSAEAGVFDLRAPADLLRKLEHDYDRLATNPADSYAAFDFFVTALHMPEWMRKSGHPITPQPGYEREILRVCEHIGNGSKHFTVNRHHSAKSTGHQGSAFNAHAFQANAFQVGRLVVELEEEPAKYLGKSIDAVSLAQRLLDYWKAQVV